MNDEELKIMNTYYCLAIKKTISKYELYVDGVVKWGDIGFFKYSYCSMCRVSGHMSAKYHFLGMCHACPQNVNPLDEYPGCKSFITLRNAMEVYSHKRYKKKFVDYYFKKRIEFLEELHSILIKMDNKTIISIFIDHDSETKSKYDEMLVSIDRYININ